jgi:hypothetical protein
MSEEKKKPAPKKKEAKPEAETAAPVLPSSALSHIER